MGARIIHFGLDDCHRVPVLKCAGYSIADCQSIAQLRTALESTQEAGAVVMTRIEDLAPRFAISITRATSAAPMVLFPGRASSILEPEFDLVVPALTPPEQWLSEMAALIDRSFAIRAHSQVVRAQSALLRQETDRAIRKSQLERMRSRTECAKNREISGVVDSDAVSEVHRDADGEDHGNS